jgi:hypothetical protein
VNTSANRIIRIGVNTLLLGMIASVGVAAEVDAREIVRRAVLTDQKNWQGARNYGYSERVDERRLNSSGDLKTKEITLYDVTLPEGTPYRRITGRGDLPLRLAEDRKEREKLLASIAQRRRETAAQRSTRLAAYEAPPKWRSEAWTELPDAFDFRLIGQETLGDYRVHVIAATPRPGYKPRSGTAKLFRGLLGKLWVGMEDYQLVRAEVEVTDDLWFGLFLVRLAKGATASFEMVRTDQSVWLPLRVRALASVRIGLIHVRHLQHEIRYSDGRDLRTPAQITTLREGR